MQDIYLPFNLQEARGRTFQRLYPLKLPKNILFIIEILWYVKTSSSSLLRVELSIVSPMSNLSKITFSRVSRWLFF